jgi:tetratricopeptide (TPR) repeat protein
MTHRSLRTAAVVSALLAAAPAAAEAPFDADVTAREARRQMLRRGDSAGEISLALAALYGRAKRQRELFHFVTEARRQGIAASRTTLLLGAFYRSIGRYDAAFSTLVRVLVLHEDQPFALVELWKTLYECKLQGTEVKTDTDAVRERLANAGLHFPQKFKITSSSMSKARRLTATAYNALLAGNTQFAAELFEAAIDAFPSDPQAHRGLGIARARLQDFARAAGAYLLYLELNPQASDADEVDRVLMRYWRGRSREVK